jgi:hypothetical protein
VIKPYGLRCCSDLDGGADEEEETPIYEKYNALLNGNSPKKTEMIDSHQLSSSSKNTRKGQ